MGTMTKRFLAGICALIIAAGCAAAAPSGGSFFAPAGITASAEGTATAALQPSIEPNVGSSLIKRSFITAEGSGFMKVSYDENTKRVNIDYFDSAFNFTGKRWLELELPVWGGFYRGANAFYIVEGRNNTSLNNGAEVMRVIKYDLNWNRIGAASIRACDQFGHLVRRPFESGSVEFAETGNRLYIVTGHEGCDDEAAGQGFLMVTVNTSSMTGSITDADLYSSFGQYIKADSGEFFVLEESAGDRCTKLSKGSAETDSRTSSVSLLDYGGNRGAYYASADDIALSRDNVLCVGTTIDQSQYDTARAYNAPHNLLLTVNSREDLSPQRAVFLTGYNTAGKSFDGVKLTKINDNRFMVSWQEHEDRSLAQMQPADEGDTLSAFTLHYLFVDGSGNVVSSHFTANAAISDCHPVVSGSDVVFYSAIGTDLDLYRINGASGSFYKKTYRVAGDHAAWDFDGETLTVTGSGDISLDNSLQYISPVSSCSGSVNYYSGNNVWYGISSKIKNIVIGEGITYVPDGAFYGLPELENITLPSTLRSVGSKAFGGHGKLYSVNLPASLASIGGGAFDSGRYVSAVFAAEPGTVGANYVKSLNGGNFAAVQAYLLYDISKASIAGIEKTYNYSGKPIEPVPQVVFSDGTVIDPVYVSNSSNILQYDVDYSDNTKLGTATVTLTGTGKPDPITGIGCTGTLSGTFDIEGILLTKDDVTVSAAEYKYDGSEKKPAVAVKRNGKPLKQDKDYTVDYSDNINSGSASVIIMGAGDYAGEVNVPFEIEAAQITADNVTISPTGYTYDGSEKKPSVTVKVGDNELKADTDFTVSYSDNTDAGSAKVTVTGIGNYTGQAEIGFTISPADISSDSITEKITEDGAALYDGDKILVLDTDFTAELTEDGITVTGIGNYTGERVIKLSAGNELTDKNAALAETEVTFDGAAKKPAVVVKVGDTELTEGTDYKVTYSNNVNAGTAYATVTGEGKYTGTVKLAFTIKPKKITDMPAFLEQDLYTYDGTPKTPLTAILDGENILMQGKDYNVEYSDNINAGTAKVVFKGKGNYTDTIVETFAIDARDIGAAIFVLSQDSFIYDGKEKKPAVAAADGTVPLTEGKDYTVSYADNINKGTGQVIINGIGNYKNTTILYFKITGTDSSSTASVPDMSFAEYPGIESPDSNVKKPVTRNYNNIERPDSSYYSYAAIPVSPQTTYTSTSTSSVQTVSQSSSSASASSSDKSSGNPVTGAAKAALGFAGAFLTAAAIVVHRRKK